MGKYFHSSPFNQHWLKTILIEAFNEMQNCAKLEKIKMPELSVNFQFHDAHLFVESVQGCDKRWDDKKDFCIFVKLSFINALILSLMLSKKNQKKHIYIYIVNINVLIVFLIFVGVVVFDKDEDSSVGTFCQLHPHKRSDCCCCWGRDRASFIRRQHTDKGWLWATTYQQSFACFTT